MRKICDYYYISYYKFFKIWQSDSDSARNAKAMIALILVIIWLGIFGKLYDILISKEPLDLAGRYKPLGYLITLPLIFLVFNSIKTYYPNGIEKNFFSGFLVSITIPVALVIMFFLLS